MNKDYYKTLNINRNASQAEVKKAFRTLSKQHHPDKGGDANTFKEMSEAYDTLSDETKRREYDTRGQNPFSQFNQQRGPNMDDLVNQFFGRRQQPQRPNRKGRGLNIPLQVELEDVFFGRNKKIKYKRQVNCGGCNATGGEHYVCRTCHGRGTIQHAVGNAFFRQLHQAECSACNGRGKIITRPCSTCGGSARINKENTVEFSIPQDLMTGQVYTFRNLGDEIKGGEAGDLQIQVVITKHQHFNILNKDLVYEPVLSVLDMILGCKVEVPYFEGPIMAQVPEGSDVEESFIIRGKGLRTPGGPGNIMIKPKIVTPQHLTHEEKETLKILRDKKKN